MKIVTLFILMASLGAIADVELVKEGKPTAEIVIAKDAIQGVKLAAEDLRKHLERMSGAALPLVNAPTLGVKNQVYVGESEFTRKLGFIPAKFTNSGFEIVAEGNYVILAGPDRQWKAWPYNESTSDIYYNFRNSAITGAVAFPKPKDYPSPGLKAWQDLCGEKFTSHHSASAVGAFNEVLKIHTNDDLCSWYAVAALLEQLGVRWYMPYENGTVIPKMKTITIPEQRLKTEAAFGKREWCYYNAMRADPEGVAWLKRLKAGTRDLALFNHTSYDIYSSYEQQVLHPEYLARDGEGKPYGGWPPGRGIPRYTDPGFRRAAVTFMNKVFEAQPDLRAMSVGQPDGGMRLDARDLAHLNEKGTASEKTLSVYGWDFHLFLADALKQSHPDKRLVYMAYGKGFGDVPRPIKGFPDNTILGLIDNSPGRVENVIDQRILAGHRAWLNAMKTFDLPLKNRVMIWDYFLYYRPSFPRCPVVFTRSLQAQMRRMEPYAMGKFIEIQTAQWADGTKGKAGARLGVPGLIHLMVYWQNKLFWDPKADRENVMNEYYRLFFGPAEAEMKAFYEFAEAVWSRQESRGLTATTGFLKEKDVDKYFDLLAKARSKVGEGTVYDKRIALIEDEMKSLKKLFTNLKRQGPDIRAYCWPAAEFTIDGDVSEYDISKYCWYGMRDLKTGKATNENATRVAIALTPDKSALIVAAICYENKMAMLKTDCATNDDTSIFNDDVIEVYLNTPERSYFKIVVNPNGAIWDESTDSTIVARDTLPILWNPGVKAAVKKYPDRWTAEILIPIKDFGSLGPDKTYPWGIEIGRSRFTGGTPENWAIAPTGGGYNVTNKWGNLWN